MRAFREAWRRRILSHDCFSSFRDIHQHAHPYRTAGRRINAYYFASGAAVLSYYYYSSFAEDANDENTLSIASRQANGPSSTTKMTSLPQLRMNGVLSSSFWNKHDSQTTHCEGAHDCSPRTAADIVKGLSKATTNNHTQIKSTTDHPKNVLIVGCGLTGVLTAHQLHRHFHRNSTTAQTLHMDMVERATYPAGRFGARATLAATGNNSNNNNKAIVADIGAQVLSTVNPDDYRALGGHGVTRDDLRTAQRIVDNLKQHQCIERVPDTALGDTDERMIWEGLWEHYSAPGGLSSVLEALIPPGSQPLLGVRVDSIDRLKDGRFRVKCVQRKSETVKGETSDQFAVQDIPFCREYDVVVVCVSAPDALSIGGLASHLKDGDDAANTKTPSALHVLQSVGYDRRTCEAHFFAPKLRPHFAKLFGSSSTKNHSDTSDTSDTIDANLPVLELRMEDPEHEVWSNFSYISWQDPKRGVFIDSGGDMPCSVVVHSKATSGEQQPLPLKDEAFDEWLAQNMELPISVIQASRLKKKSIAWKVSQMIRPMEAVLGDPPPNGSWQCLVVPSSSKQGGGRFIIAGDFMTQSSFVGCVASADAAAKETMRYLHECS